MHHHHYPNDLYSQASTLTRTHLVSYSDTRFISSHCSPTVHLQHSPPHHAYALTSFAAAPHQHHCVQAEEPFTLMLMWKACECTKHTAPNNATAYACKAQAVAQDAKALIASDGECCRGRGGSSCDDD